MVTLDDLLEELQRGRIYECSLRDPHFILDGIQDGERIFIDPRPSIIHTLVHELLHRRKPTWSERRVARETDRLVSTMGDADVALWWARYRRVRKPSRPVEIADD